MNKAISQTSLILLLILCGNSVSAGNLNTWWHETVHDEKMVVWTDRDVYIAGEHMFFTCNLIRCAEQNSQYSQRAYLAIRGLHGLVGRARVRLSDAYSGHGHIYLSDTLSTGFYEVLGFTNWMRNQGEASYFRKTILIVNRFDDQPARVFASTGHDMTRSTNEDDQSGPEDIHHHGREARMKNDLLRFSLHPDNTSGKRQRVRLTIHPGTKFTSVQSLQIAVAPDLSMQSFPVSDYQDADVQPTTRMFARETTHQILSAKVMASNDQKPMQGVRVFLHVPDTIPNMLVAESCPKGLVHFQLNGYYEDKELVFGLERGDNSEMQLNILDPFDFHLPLRTPPVAFDEHLMAYITHSQEVIKIRKTFEINDVQMTLREDELMRNRPTPPLVYTSPLHVIHLDDYVPLDNLREIVRELIPVWRLRSTANQTTHRLICQTTRKPLPGPPVFFVDGVIRTDISPWMQAGSDELREIQILNLNWMHGDIHMPGIISIHTRTQERFGHPDSKVRYVNETMHVPGQIRSPSYDNTETHQHGIPDLRQLLFLKTMQGVAPNSDLHLHWYTGDISGTYVVHAKGLTVNGEAFYEQIIMAIKQ